MSSNYVVVRLSDNKIVNSIKLADNSIWTPPEGCEKVLNTVGYDIGGTLVGGTYTPPAPPATPVVDLNAVDLANLNKALVEPGSVVRALGLVMFAEINKLRVKNGDAAYTMNQFITALQNQMR